MKHALQLVIGWHLTFLSGWGASLGSDIHHREARVAGEFRD
jgi:hypothetical protein